MSTTCRERLLQWPLRLTQQGFAIVSAIFILVVLAALGAFAVSVSSTQHLTFAQDLQGARAYQAAQAGMEWGIAQVANNGAGYACSTGCTMTDCATPTPGSANSTLAALPGHLAGFTVRVECRCTPYCEGPRTAANPVRIHTLTVTATQGTAVGNIDYIERQLTATVEAP